MPCRIAPTNYCHGHDNCPTNYVIFPPNHTNATINPVFRHCDHPFGDDPDDPDEPKIFLEVEVGRDTATGWQHLAWVDTDLETPGLQQRTAITRDNPPTVNWNAKATSSAPLADGTDSHVYDSSTTFARALPAVSAGQYVPPPFATIVSRTYDDNDTLIIYPYVTSAAQPASAALHVLGEAKALLMPLRRDFRTGEPLRIPPLYTRNGETVFDLRTVPGVYELFRIIR